MSFTQPCVPYFEQIPLYQIVEQDDILLLNSELTEWFRILNYFPWRAYCEAAALYYNALYNFNQADSDPANGNSIQADKERHESKEEAAHRLLSQRPTVDKTKPILYEPQYKTPSRRVVTSSSVAPGCVPAKDGKKPKCFFALLKSFIGAQLMGFPGEPEKVYDLLTSNPSFARVCGFLPKTGADSYCQKDIPCRRKLEQFDQIMTEYGIWDMIKWKELAANIKNGVIQEENVAVGDTTHFHAYSAFETVHYKDEEGKDKKKSQSKVTKPCNCEDKNNCPHEWELADDGAGTIVKKHNTVYWGHKAAIIGLPLQGVPLDAAAVADGATNDGQTFLPHVERLFQSLPEVQPWIDTALYDSASDDKELKELFQEKWNITLKTSINPRRRQIISQGLPTGMDKLTPFGNLTCKAGIEMDYKGARYETEKFIYQAPLNDKGGFVCSSCEHKPICSPYSDKGRVVTIPFDLLPHINPNDAPMAKRFKAMMTRRPAIERIIKRLKCDLGDDRLTKRGNDAFQAYLDKTMIAFHILLRN